MTNNNISFYYDNDDCNHDNVYTWSSSVIHEKKQKSEAGHIVFHNVLYDIQNQALYCIVRIASLLIIWRGPVGKFLLY